MDVGTDGGGELKECKSTQDGRWGGGGGESGMSGISEWDESIMGGETNVERMIRCGTIVFHLA